MSRTITTTVALILVSLGASGCSDFNKHRARYEGVVRRARQLATTLNKTIRFRGDWAFDPVASASDTNVCARRMSNGGFFVRITAYDWHHAGRRGYVFADPPMSGDQISTAFDLYGCGEWERMRSIEKHWWAISSRLD